MVYGRRLESENYECLDATGRKYPLSSCCRGVNVLAFAFTVPKRLETSFFHSFHLRGKGPSSCKCYRNTFSDTIPYALKSNCRIQTLIKQESAFTITPKHSKASFIPRTCNIVYLSINSRQTLSAPNPLYTAWPAPSNRSLNSPS